MHCEEWYIIAVQQDVLEGLVNITATKEVYESIWLYSKHTVLHVFSLLFILFDRDNAFHLPELARKTRFHL